MSAASESGGELKAARRWADTALSAVFLLTISLPLGVLLLRRGAADVDGEKRAVAPLPEVPRELDELGSFARDCERWFGDRFGFRAALVHANARLRVLGLGTSTSDQVVLGEDGWLYYASFRILDDRRGLNPFTEAELRAWQRLLERRHDRLAERGIAYVCVVLPEKSTIHPEHLPARLREVQGPSRLDQLVRHMQAASHVRVLDVRPAMLAARAGGALYHRTDTHWNDRGALAAYRAIAAALAVELPGLTPLAPEDVLERAQREPFSGDLAGMLGLRGILREDPILVGPRFVKSHPAPAGAAIEGRTALYGWQRERVPRVLETGEPELPRLLAVHDSFFLQILPFLAEHFSRTVGLSHTFPPPEVLEAEAPDVVLDEWVERRLSQPLPADVEDPVGPGSG